VAIENYGGTHIDCDIDGLCIDVENKVVTSAACVPISVSTGST
jgi:enhancing lycopene biosynthesis protein 2